MNKSLPRAYVAELLGTFAVVFFGAGVVCVNYLTAPAAAAEARPAAPGGGGPAGTGPGAALTRPERGALTGSQPGLVGVALVQGVIYAVMLAATVPLAGGYLNPAVTVTLWVFGRLESVLAAWLVGAQLLGGVLAGLCLRYTFADEVLIGARLGTPHLNPAAYGGPSWGAVLAGSAVELTLTFFLVFAMFGALAPGGRGEGGWSAAAGWAAGGVWAAAVLLALPLTGASLNPARWFGPAFWEWSVYRSSVPANPFSEAFVYTAGPVAGALLAGVVRFWPAASAAVGREEQVNRKK